MKYISTRGTAPVLSFDDVLLEGPARDGGLYVPESWPRLAALPSGGYAETVATVVAPFVAGSLAKPRLAELAAGAYAEFRHPEVAPLRRIDDGHHLLELFWGPTLSFKDYALSLVGSLFEVVLTARGNRILVLGATSGDTGSAAIEALAERESIEVVVLYPQGRVTEIQRRQMTTVKASNVRAVAVEGTFDDCQDLVKLIFSDPELRRRFGLAAINSMNWARVMAQSAYYLWVAAQLGTDFQVAVPTGNFGNVLSAEVAAQMGAPIRRLIVGNNANHGLATLIETGRLPLGAVVATTAPAMDIAVPSNLERLLFELYERDPARVRESIAGFRSTGELVLDPAIHQKLARRFSAGWSDDADLAGVMAMVHEQHGLVIDPHTAAAWAAAEEAADPDIPVVIVATAHPAKFPEAVERAVGVRPELPADLADLSSRDERLSVIRNDPRELVEVLAGLR